MVRKRLRTERLRLWRVQEKEQFVADARSASGRFAGLRRPVGEQAGFYASSYDIIPYASIEVTDEYANGREAIRMIRT